MGHRCFPAWLADVPHLDAALASRVHVLGGVGHGDRADNIAVGKGVDLSYVSRDTRPDEGVCGEGHCSCLSLSVHVERVGPATVEVSLLSLPAL